jgi:hypothetical protein
MRVFRSVVLSVILLVSLAAQSQSVSSVYSNNGIGLLNYQGLPHNLGMGEIGIGVPSLWNMNYQNPAFLPLNGVTMFQVGIEMDRRTIESSAVNGKKITGGLRYLNLAMPIISGKWTTAIGVTPYSTVNNKTVSFGVVDADVNTITTYQGSGGITAFQWSNGFRLRKGVYAGVRTSLLFGSIENLENSIINDGSGSYGVEFTDKSSYSGVKIDAFLGYRKVIDDAHILNFGLAYELGNDLNGTRDQLMQTSVLAEREVAKNEPFGFSLPSSIGLGSSYQVMNKLTVGADISFTNWSNAGGLNDNFRNTIKFGLGAEIVPDYDNVNNYYKRIAYRAGVSFGELPYSVDGNQIREVGINFGGSFPVGISSLDWALKYGRLGTLDNDLVRETYFRIVIGASMNDRWFIKRRYD